MSWIRLIKIILVNIIVLALLVLLLEGVFWTARKAINKNSLGFLVDIKSQEDIPVCDRMKTHPVLAYSPDTKGECNVRDGIARDDFVFYDYNSNGPAIITLGGSTTSGYYQNISNGFTWPLLLHNLVSKKGYQVINGGVGGYTSSQELLKLITEVRRLKNVELIISLNGINETPSYPGGKIYDINTKYPFLRLVQYQMLQSQRWIDQRVTFYGTSVWLPNIKSFIRFITEDSISEVDILMAKDTNLDKNYNDGLKYKYIDASERWLSNIKSMHAVSNNLGINYMVFLQPTMGVSGPQSLMPLNTESPDAIMLNELFENEKEYISEINNLYNKLRQYCSELDYCIDISNIAPPMINNYNDYRHHNENGNKIIAEEVAKNINNFSQ